MMQIMNYATIALLVASAVLLVWVLAF